MSIQRVGKSKHLQKSIAPVDLVRLHWHMLPLCTFSYPLWNVWKGLLFDTKKVASFLLTKVPDHKADFSVCLRLCPLCGKNSLKNQIKGAGHTSNSLNLCCYIGSNSDRASIENNDLVDTWSCKRQAGKGLSDCANGLISCLSARTTFPTSEVWLSEPLPNVNSLNEFPPLLSTSVLRQKNPQPNRERDIS